jgi:hypothetical protein
LLLGRFAFSGTELAPAAVAESETRDVVTLPEKATQQLSYSGTPRFRDQTQPDEYVRDLAEPTKRMELFDEMRSSDEGINTALAAREQLIGSASWQLTNADDSDRGKEILEFCEDNIYPVLPEMLRHLAGAMQYGFGVVEKVFAWNDRPFARNIARGKVRRTTRDSGRRVYLRKLAHIRQRTIQTFLVPQGGDLTALRQYVWDGFTLRKADISVDKVLMWTYNRRGDDYWGVPPMRHAYKAWKFKMQLEKLNLLGVDRFGVGTPVAEVGENWSEPEIAQLKAFLAAFRSGENSYLLHPAGGKIAMVSGDGSMLASVLEWVKWYNIAIAKTFLTQGTELGSTETGARALGETFEGQTEAVVQSDCEDIASIVNELLVIPLVQFNFGDQEDYPIFQPSPKIRASSAFATAITQLIGKAVKWGERDEVWIRDKYELPEIDVDARAAEEEKQAKLQKLLPAPAPQLALPPGTPPSADNPATARAGALSLSQLTQLSIEVADGAPDPAVPGESTHRTREYSEWEMRILRPDVLSRDLDVQSARLTGEVHEVLREIDQELAEDAARLARRGAPAIAAGVRDVAVSSRLRSKLRRVMLEAAKRARDYGVGSVHTEIARQEAPEAIGPQRAPDVSFFGLAQVRAFAQQLAADLKAAALASDPTPEEQMRDLQLSAEVDRAVEDEIDRREQSVRNNLLTAMAMAGTLSIAKLIEVVRVAVSQALESLSTGRTEMNVQGVVNIGFGVGRSEAAAEIVARAKSSPVTRPDISPRPGDTGGAGGTGTPGRVVGHIPQLVGKIYSAVMDFGTCDECAKWDGARFPVNYPEDLTGVQAPNPRCHGGYSKCRCVWIYVTDREVGSITPSAKGPLPEYVPFSRSAA